MLGSGNAGIANDGNVSPGMAGNAGSVGSFGNAMLGSGKLGRAREGKLQSVTAHV